MQLITASEDLPRLLFAQRIPNYRIVLIRCQNQPQRRIIAIAPPFPVEIVDVKLHLAEIAVRQFPHLEVDQYEALQNRVVKNQIDIKVIAIERNPLLPRDKRKSLPQ